MSGPRELLTNAQQQQRSLHALRDPRQVAYLRLNSVYRQSRSAGGAPADTSDEGVALELTFP